MLSGINNSNFSFFGFSNLSFFVFVFTTLKKIFIFKYFSIDLILFQVKALLTGSVTNLGNTTNLNSSL